MSDQQQRQRKTHIYEIYRVRERQRPAKTLNVRILFMFRPNFFAIEFQAEYVHYAGRTCILSVIAFGKSCRDAVNGELNAIESKMKILQEKFTRDTPEPFCLPIAEGISNWNLYNNHNRNQEQVK